MLSMTSEFFYPDKLFCSLSLKPNHGLPKPVSQPSKTHTFPHSLLYQFTMTFVRDKNKNE